MFAREVQIFDLKAAVPDLIRGDLEWGENNLPEIALRQSLRSCAVALLPLLLIIGRADIAAAIEIRNPWPPVAPVRRTFDVPNAHNASIKLDINGIDGKPLYRLECHDGDYLSRATCYRCAEGSFSYVGLLQCRLSPVKPLAFSFSDYNALVPYPAGDGQSRAAFSTDELVGKCADYPEWARVRHFRLRGMRITLSIDALALDHKGAATSYRFAVNVEPDPDALSAIEGPSEYAAPEDEDVRRAPTCEKVVREHVPGVVTEEYIRQEGLEPPYPRIQAIEETLTFSSVNTVHTTERIRGVEKKVTLSQPTVSEHGFIIHGERGEPVYEFRCPSGGSYGSVHPDGFGIVCMLRPYGRKINLLADSIDPYTLESRAAFDSAHTLGTCGKYPGWGLVRLFELRGMRLTVSFQGSLVWGFSSPDWDYRKHPEAKSPPQLRVQVEPDPAARSPVAQPSRYVDSRFIQPIINGQTVPPGRTVIGPVQSGVNGEILNGQVLTQDLMERESRKGVYLVGDRCGEVLTHQPATFPSR